MAVQTVFTTQVPTNTNAVQGSPLTVALTVVPTVDGNMVGARWYAGTDSPAGTYTLTLYAAATEDVPGGNGTGTPLGSISVPLGDIVPGTWNAFYFASPIPVTAYHVYRVALRMSVGLFTVTGALFASDLVSGDLLAPASEQLRLDFTPAGAFYNGTYVESDAAYPNQTFNANGYFVDVLFDAGDTPEEHTTTGSAPFAVTATGAESTTRTTAETATATVTATAVATSSRTTVGAAPVVASATAVDSTVRQSTGNGRLAVGATGAESTTRTTAETARVGVKAGTYAAAAAPGPWLTTRHGALFLITRNRPPRIVSSTQVAS